jgi:hypothetical protein
MIFTPSNLFGWATLGLILKFKNLIFLGELGKLPHHLSSYMHGEHTHKFLMLMLSARIVPVAYISSAHASVPEVPKQSKNSENLH